MTGTLGLPTHTILDFFVRGTPAPQGSKHGRPIYRGRGETREFTGKVAMVESSGTRLSNWRQDVKAAAEQAISGPISSLFPLDCSVVVGMVFHLARPKSHYRARGGVLLPGAPAWPAVRPDLSHLIRATEDALTDAGVWTDDKLVIEYTRLRKVYAVSGTAPGARITIGRAA
jgi:crossover junction endodeoxyribonuclease RusA